MNAYIGYYTKKNTNEIQEMIGNTSNKSGYFMLNLKDGKSDMVPFITLYIPELKRTIISLVLGENNITRVETEGQMYIVFEISKNNINNLIEYCAIKVNGVIIPEETGE